MRLLGVEDFDPQESRIADDSDDETNDRKMATVLQLG